METLGLMKEDTAKKTIALLLITVAVLAFALKQFLYVPAEENESIEGFDLTLSIIVHKAQKGMTLKVPTPISREHIQVVSQSLSQEGWTLQKQSYALDDARGLTYSAQADRKAILLAKYAVKLVNIEGKLPPKKRKLSKYLTVNPAFYDKDAHLPDYFLDYLEELKNDEITFSRIELVELLKRLIDENELSDKQSAKQCYLPAEVLNAINLLRQANIPSRQTCGVIMVGSMPLLNGWVEIYADNQWWPLSAFDQDSLYLPFAYDTFKLVTLTPDASKFDVVLNAAFTGDEEEAEEIGFGDKFYDALSFASLSYDMKEALKVILLLPLLVMLLALLKTTVSMPSLGILTPVLLSFAIAFKDSVLMITMILAMMIPIVAIQLLMKHLSKIYVYLMTTAISGVLFAAFVSIMNVYGKVIVTTDMVIPIIVIIMIADKFATAIGKDGSWIAMQRLGFTVLFALVGAFILNIQALGQFIFQYPELNLLIALAVMWLSRNQMLNEKVEEVK